MNTVKIKKSELLEKVKANRGTHRDLFLKAQEGYREEVIIELDKMLSDARNGRQIIRSISMPEPIDHTSDYDRIISMLEMSVDDYIDLTANEFEQYVLDNWAWKEFALLTNTQYLK